MSNFTQEFEDLTSVVQNNVYDVFPAVSFNTPITDQEGNRSGTFSEAVLVRGKDGQKDNTSIITMAQPDNDFDTFWYFVVDQKVGTVLGNKLLYLRYQISTILLIPTQNCERTSIYHNTESYWPHAQVPRIKFGHDITAKHIESEVGENVVHEVTKISQGTDCEYFVSRLEMSSWSENETNVIRSVIQRVRSLQNGEIRFIDIKYFVFSQPRPDLCWCSVRTAPCPASSLPPTGSSRTTTTASWRTSTSSRR